MISVASLIKAWPEIGLQSRAPNPYRGLQAFREQDAPSFFGRDSDIQDVVEAVQHHGFIAVVGASGSGKSSLVFAGAAARLRGDEHWLLADFRPRRDPTGELATALAPLLYPALDKLERREHRNQLANKLADHALSVADVLAILAQENPGKRLLLIADQFEELYTQHLGQDQQHQFIDGLLEAVQSQGTPLTLTLLLTLRADFMDQALHYGPLARALDAAPKKILGPMDEAGLQSAIASPAQQLGVTLEEGLAERILQDLGREPGVLPLLEFTLTRLWERQTQRQLTHAAYEAIGGVQQALTRHAKAVYDGFHDLERERLRRVFVQLVRPGEGTEDTRQVATREQVGTDNWPLVTALADARLVVTGRDEESGQETVELVHEALIRQWQPLRHWIEAARRFRVWQNRLRQALREWQEQNHDAGALLRGTRLAEAEEQLKEHAQELSPAERTYIEAGILVRQREAAVRTRWRWGITVALLVVALIMAGLAGYSYYSTLEAQAQRKQAEAAQELVKRQRDQALRNQSQFLTSLSQQRTKAGDANQGILLALEALPRDMAAPNRPYVAEAEAALYQAVLAPHHIATLTGHQNSVRNASFSPDGRHLVTASWDGTARLWDVATGKEITVLRGHQGEVLHAAFNPDGTRVVTASEDGTARVWDVASGASVVVLKVEEFEKPIWYVAFSPAFSPTRDRIVTVSRSGIFEGKVGLWDVTTGNPVAVLKGISGDFAAFHPHGGLIITVAGDYTVRLWDASTGAPAGELRGHRGPVSYAAFSPDGRRIVTTSWDGTARVWDPTTCKETALLPVETALFRGPESTPIPSSMVWHAAFSPDGSGVVTASWSGFRLWDATTGTEIASLGTERGVGILNTRVAFSADGHRIVTLERGGARADLWDVRSEDAIAVLRGHEDSVRHVAFSADGQRIVTASDDRTARLWDVRSGSQLAVLPRQYGSIRDTTFSPDGRWGLTGSYGGLARLWDATNGTLIASMAMCEVGEGVILAAFTPDGSRVVTASRNGTVRLWNTMNGVHLLATLHSYFITRSLGCVESPSHYPIVFAAVLSPDGHHVVTTAQDGTARIFRLFPTTQELIDHARKLVPRRLSDEERRRFFLGSEEK
jgi:WD40 repeat protein